MALLLACKFIILSYMTFKVNFHIKESLLQATNYVILSSAHIFSISELRHFLLVLDFISYSFLLNGPRNNRLYSNTYVCVHIYLYMCIYYYIYLLYNIFIVIYIYTHRYNLCSVFVKHNKHVFFYIIYAISLFTSIYVI